MVKNIERLSRLVQKYKYPWSIQPHSAWDKSFDIEGAGVLVDYDDVDHKEADEIAWLIVELHNYSPKVFSVLDAIYKGDLEITSTRGTAAAREHLDALLSSLK